METLNEALNIAAFDIATAAGDQIQSDEDEVDHGETDDIKSSPLNSMAFEFEDKKTEFRAIGLANVSSRFVIQSDGSFSRS